MAVITSRDSKIAAIILGVFYLFAWYQISIDKPEVNPAFWGVLMVSLYLSVIIFFLWLEPMARRYFANKWKLDLVLASRTVSNRGYWQINKFSEGRPKHTFERHFYPLAMLMGLVMGSVVIGWIVATAIAG